MPLPPREVTARCRVCEPGSRPLGHGLCGRRGPGLAAPGAVVVGPSVALRPSRRGWTRARRHKREAGGSESEGEDGRTAAEVGEAQGRLCRPRTWVPAPEELERQLSSPEPWEGPAATPAPWLVRQDHKLAWVEATMSGALGSRGPRPTPTREPTPHSSQTHSACTGHPGPRGTHGSPAQDCRLSQQPPA